METYQYGLPFACSDIVAVVCGNDDIANQRQAAYRRSVVVWTGDHGSFQGAPSSFTWAQGLDLANVDG